MVRQLPQHDREHFPHMLKSKGREPQASFSITENWENKVFQVRQTEFDRFEPIYGEGEGGGGNQLERSSRLLKIGNNYLPG